MHIPNSTNRRSPLCASLLPLRVCSACLLVCYLTQPLTKTTPMSEASPLVEMLHTADTFVPRQVEWVWEPWISRGYHPPRRGWRSREVLADNGHRRRSNPWLRLLMNDATSKDAPRPQVRSTVRVKRPSIQ